MRFRKRFYRQKRQLLPSNEMLDISLFCYRCLFSFVTMNTSNSKCEQTANLCHCCSLLIIVAKSNFYFFLSSFLFWFNLVVLTSAQKYENSCLHVKLVCCVHRDFQCNTALYVSVKASQKFSLQSDPNFELLSLCCLTNKPSFTRTETQFRYTQEKCHVLNLWLTLLLDFLSDVFFTPKFLRSDQPVSSGPQNNVQHEIVQSTSMKKIDFFQGRFLSPSNRTLNIT